MAGQESSQGATPTVRPVGRLATVGSYCLLLVFGSLQGLTGSLQFSRGVGHVPLAAIGFALAIGYSCAVGGRGMGSAWGAIWPAAVWLLASFAVAMPENSGTVVITNTAAGQVYLYGGALCAAIGVGVGISGWRSARTARMFQLRSASLQRRLGR